MAAASQRWKPQPRRDALVVERVEGETLVYDRETHAAHCLGPAAARLFALADGTRTIGELASAAKLDADEVEAIVGDLVRAQVLALPRGMTRRHLARRTAALVGGAITSIVVPEAAAAASCVGLLGNCGSRPCCPGLVCVLRPTLIRICL